MLHYTPLNTLMVSCLIIWFNVFLCMSCNWKFFSSQVGNTLSHPFPPVINYSSIHHFSSLSHVDNSGQPKMVDVSNKTVSLRTATAEGRISLTKQAIDLLEDSNRSPKGPVLSVARLAAIMAIKQCSVLIPLCHAVPVTGVDLDFHICNEEITAEVTVRSVGVTGVEMEALTGVSIALLTIYDMTKSISHKHTISEIKLISKTGGKCNIFG